MEQAPETTTDEQTIARGIRSGQIIYLSIGSAVVSYVVIAYVLSLAQSPFHGVAQLPEVVKPILRYAFWGASVAFVLPMALFIRRMLLDPNALRSQVKSASDFSRLYFVQAVVIGGLSESPAVLGFVLFLLTGGWVDLLGLCFLAVAYLAVMFPSAMKASALAEEMARGREE